MISRIRSLLGSKPKTNIPLQNNQLPPLESSDISENDSSHDNLEKEEE